MRAPPPNLRPERIVESNGRRFHCPDLPSIDRHLAGLSWRIAELELAGLWVEVIAPHVPARYARFVCLAEVSAAAAELLIPRYRQTQDALLLRREYMLTVGLPMEEEEV